MLSNTMQPTTKQYILLLAVACGIFFFVYESPDPTAPTARVVPHAKANVAPVRPVPPAGEFQYLEITESCGPDFDGRPCILAYDGPGTTYDTVQKLRNGMVLKVKGTVIAEGMTWYRVHFDEWLRYPERLQGDWYVPVFAGRIVMADGTQELSSATPKTNKRILVDLSENRLYAYEGDTLFLTTWVATGVQFSPTPIGTFTVYKKTPSRYMQGPLPGVNDNPFDLPGVPWDLYFTEGGAVIHGSYWHNRYASEESSGCVNLPPELAKILYDWAPLGTRVIIRQ